MDSSHAAFALYATGAAALVALLPKVRARLMLSGAKHRSLEGHSRMSRRLASFIPFYEYNEAEFFRADRAPDDVVARRRAGFGQLADYYRAHFPITAQLSAEAAEDISDLQFTVEAYRVPFQYSRLVREQSRRRSPSWNPRAASPSPISTAMCSTT
jgi:glutamate-1-semialdehyde 2,1-aminomutase